jgi:uncharacterized membrane protein (UPF0127 family)
MTIRIMRYNSPGSIRQILVVLVVFALALGIYSPAHAQGQLHSLEIVTKTRRETFEVEVASTREQRARGLMFRKEIAARGGMLFDFGRDQEIRMWMKDTLIPLDMIFIENDGRILRIEQNAEPESLRLISSDGSARMVLEVKAGIVRKFDISAGDRVIDLPVDQ